MKRIFAVVALAVGSVVLGFGAFASPASAAWDSDVAITYPAGLTAGNVTATFTAAAGQPATCVDITQTLAVTATAGTVTETVGTAVDGCVYSVSFSGEGALGGIPLSDAVFISEANPDVSRSLVKAPVAGIANGTSADVTGDSIADVINISWDYVIEYVPTVLGVFAALYTFFLGARLFMLVVSKTNSAFKGLVRRS